MTKQYKSCHAFEEHIKAYEFAGGSVIQKGLRNIDLLSCCIIASYDSKHTLHHVAFIKYSEKSL